jgi:hypothetical protein
VEGVNVGAILLGYLGALVLGITSLVALGLLIARQTKAALITFAAGLLVTAGIAALATLSFLQKGYGFYVEGSEPMILLTALSLVLAGAGQFVAALQGPRTYAAAFGCAAGSMVFLAAFPEHVSRTLPEVSLGLALSLLLAVLSLMIPVIPPRRRNGVLLWTALPALGGIAGFVLGDACVTTRYTLLEGQRVPGGPVRVRVEVDVLGVRVSDETGFAPIPLRAKPDDLGIRAVSSAQVAWGYGPPAIGAAAGVVAGLIVARGITRWLRRQSGEGVHAEPLAEADRPSEHGPWSDKIKPA